MDGTRRISPPLGESRRWAWWAETPVLVDAKPGGSPYVHCESTGKSGGSLRAHRNFPVFPLLHALRVAATAVWAPAPSFGARGRETARRREEAPSRASPRAPGRPPPPAARLPGLPGCPLRELELGNTTCPPCPQKGKVAIFPSRRMVPCGVPGASQCSPANHRQRMLRVREARETPAEYLTIELLLSGEADFPAMAVATAVAMTAASCLLSGVMGRIEGSSAFSSSGIAVFPFAPRSMLRGVGGSDMLQRKDAGKAGRRCALDHRGRRRAVYCAIICTPCRWDTQ